MAVGGAGVLVGPSVLVGAGVFVGHGVLVGPTVLVGRGVFVGPAVAVGAAVRVAVGATVGVPLDPPDSDVTLELNIPQSYLMSCGRFQLCVFAES